MKKILLLIPFLSFGQDKIPSDVKHFYASFAICEITYKIQDLALPKQKPHNRFLITIGVASSAGVVKELYDQYRPNKSKRTGFDKMDLSTDLWAVLVWVPVRICINDFIKSKRIENKPIDFQDY
jgi:uncharacterized protein (DUF362 family)